MKRIKTINEFKLSFLFTNEGWFSKKQKKSKNK